MESEHQRMASPFLHTAQNGTSGIPWNPFYSTTQSRVDRDQTAVNPFSTHTDKQTTQDFSVKKVDKENNVLPRAKNLNPGQSNGLHQTQSMSPLFLDSNFDNTPFPPPDWVVLSPPEFYNGNNLQTSTNHVPDIFQTTPGSGIWDQDADIFQPFNKKTDFQHSAAIQNTEFSSSPNQKDDLLEFILSRQKNDAFQNTPAPTSPFTSADVFQEKSANTDSFFQTQWTTDDLFQSSPNTPHITDTTANSVTSDPFMTPSSITGNKVLQSTPSVQTSTLISSDIRVFDPLCDTSVSSQNDILSKNSRNNVDLLLTSTTATTVNTHVTPLSLSAVPSTSISPNGDLTFKRRPPKPTPRTKAPKPVNHPTVSSQTLLPRPPPTPAPRSTAAVQNATPASDDNLTLYEDVLLTGQERCVEDWPEDSPELSPEWKPVGKLKLRRESLEAADLSDGAPGADGHAKKNGKLTLRRKLRNSFLNRRSSKDKTGEESGMGTLARGSKLNGGSMENSDEFVLSDQDGEQNGAAEHKPKKSTKSKVIHIHRRGSKVKSDEDPSKGSNGFTLEFKENRLSSLNNPDLMTSEEKREEKDGKPKQLQKSKHPVPQRPSKVTFADGMKTLNEPPPLVESKPFPKHPSLEGNLDLGTSFSMSLHDRPQGSEIDRHPDGDEGIDEILDHSGQKQKKKVKIKFIPHRGFVIGLSKNSDAELKGANGYTPHPDLEENDKLNGLQGACGYTPYSEEMTSLKTEAGHSYSPADFKVDYHENDFHKGTDLFTPSDASEMRDCRPKKPMKFKLPRLHRRHSKSFDEAEVKQQEGHLFKAGDHNSSELKKPPILEVPPLSRRDSKNDDETPQQGADLFRAEDFEFAEDAGWEEYTPDNKPHKSKPMKERHKGSKHKDSLDFPEDLLDPPGATSDDYYLSDAAKAEWISAQMDMRRAEENERLEAVEEEGDTDSLMEWWNTVELWDELPSDENINLKEDETKSFKAIADKVHRGLRVYQKLFMERAEVLYQHVLILYAIADDLSNFHHRAKIANITGGTTTAVGGAAAIAGLALAPVTFGASIVISAIGLGVATAGGITAASATISDNLHNMHDRKKIEIIVQDYEAQLVDMLRSLQFVTEGLHRLRSHPLLRRNNYYTGDWDVRRALQTISSVSDPVERAEEITQATLTKLNSLHKGMDRYFTKDSREVKKGCKKEVTAEVKNLAKQLHESLVELNSLREQLLDATGNI